MEGQWNSTLTSAKDRQKQQFKDRVMHLYEESLVSSSLSTSNHQKTFVFPSISSLNIRHIL